MGKLRMRWAGYIALAALVIATGLGLKAFLPGGIKRHSLVLLAERKAQVGGEFLRFYDDGQAEYGYAVVSEKIKARGTYRLSGDTLYFLTGGFEAHFPEGFITRRGDILFMESRLHFTVVSDNLKGE